MMNNYPLFLLDGMALRELKKLIFLKKIETEKVLEEYEREEKKMAEDKKNIEEILKDTDGKIEELPRDKKEEKLEEKLEETKEEKKEEKLYKGKETINMLKAATFVRKLLEHEKDYYETICKL